MKVLYQEGIYLQILFLLFKCSKREKKEFFLSRANSPWFAIGDVSVTDIFAIELSVSVKRRMDRE